MRRLMIAAAFAATTGALAPLPAAAYTTRCERAHNDRVAGTVAGGVLGAIAGGAIGGDGKGALIGGAVGALAGNQLSKSGGCRRGYVSRSYDERYYDVRSNRYRPGYGADRCGWRDAAYRDPYGNVVPHQVQVCR